MNTPNPKVNWFFEKSTKWQAELKKLRTIVLDAGLHEELKWGVPTYTLEGKNVALIHYFKEYSAVLFVKGVLMKDPKHLLIQQTVNVQAGRHLRFDSVQAIVKMKPVLQAYLREAIRVEQSGQKVPHKTTSEFPVAEEFQQALNTNAALRRAFAALTPGRQRAYLLHFAAPKLATTRAARVEKCTEQILEGLGLHD